MIDYGNYIIFDDNHIVINVDVNKYGSGYTVAPLEIDPLNKYDLNDVKKWVTKHPELEVKDWNKPIKTYDELCAEIRGLRDQKIFEIEWRRTRYYDAVALGIEPPEPIEPILKYIQALRNVTKQTGFPDNVVWPTLGEV